MIKTVGGHERKKLSIYILYLVIYNNVPPHDEFYDSCV